MQRALALLVTVFSAVAWGQPVYRCAIAPGHVEYRDTPCVAGTLADPFVAADRPFDESAAGAVGDWHSGAPVDRRLSTTREENLITARVLEQQRPIDARKRTQYAENRSRCATAMRVADACGKFAGTFYCDEQGFRPIPPDPAAPRAVIDNAGRYRMERCAVETAKQPAPSTW